MSSVDALQQSIRQDRPRSFERVRKICIRKLFPAQCGCDHPREIDGKRFAREFRGAEEAVQLQDQIILKLVGIPGWEGENPAGAAALCDDGGRVFAL